MRFLSLFLSLVSLSFITADDYSSFGPASASQKVSIARDMLAQSPWTPTSNIYVGPNLQWDLPQGAIGFAEQGGNVVTHQGGIQTVPFIAQTGEKSVHRYGVAATVSFSLTSGSGAAPTTLFPLLTASNPQVGVIRFSTGTPNSMLGIAIGVFGDGVDSNGDPNVQTRVFATAPTGPKIFNVDVTQEIGGVTVQGPEGPLVFTCAPSLYGINIADNVNHDFRHDFMNLPGNTVVGFVASAPDYKGTPFNVTVTLTSQLIASQAADQNWHFRRILAGANWGGWVLLAFLKSVGVAAGFFGIVSGGLLDVNVVDPNVCPFASNPNIMNNATIAAIVVASIMTTVAVVSTTMLIKQRQTNKVTTTSIPL